MTRRSFGHPDPLQDRRRTSGNFTQPDAGGAPLTMRDANGDVPIDNVKAIVAPAGGLADLGGGVAQLLALVLQTAGSTLTVADVVRLIVPDGALTDLGGGRAQLNFAAAGIPATAIGQALLSLDGATFTPVMPLTTPDAGWLVNEAGYLLIAG